MCFDNHIKISNSFGFVDINLLAKPFFVLKKITYASRIEDSHIDNKLHKFSCVAYRYCCQLKNRKLSDYRFQADRSMRLDETSFSVLPFFGLSLCKSVDICA